MFRDIRRFEDEGVAVGASVPGEVEVVRMMEVLTPPFRKTSPSAARTGTVARRAADRNGTDLLIYWGPAHRRGRGPPLVNIRTPRPTA